MKISTLLSQLKVSPSDIGYTPGVTEESEGLTYILNAIYMWAGIVAVIVIIIAGYLFVTSRGDATQMKRSKDAIRAAVIGLVIVMMAFVITRFVIGGVTE